MVHKHAFFQICRNLQVRTPHLDLQILSNAALINDHVPDSANAQACKTGRNLYDPSALETACAAIGLPPCIPDQLPSLCCLYAFVRL